MPMSTGSTASSPALTWGDRERERERERERLRRAHLLTLENPGDLWNDGWTPFQFLLWEFLLYGLFLVTILSSHSPDLYSGASHSPNKGHAP
jgi:hypothetical protein